MFFMLGKTLHWNEKEKERERKSIYMVPFILCIVSKYSLFNLKITPCLPFLHKRSPDGATPNCGNKQPITVCYSFIDPKKMKGWVGWLLDLWGRFATYVVTRQLQVERRTGEVCQPKTNVLLLCHMTNNGSVGVNHPNHCSIIIGDGRNKCRKKT